MTNTAPEAIRRSQAFQQHVRPEETKEADARNKKYLAQLGDIEPPEGFKKITIEVYACPTPGCPDFFGHHGMPALGNRDVGLKDLNYSPKPESEHRTRATCPTCFATGLKVERVRVATFAFVPLEK